MLIRLLNKELFLFSKDSMNPNQQPPMTDDDIPMQNENANQCEMLSLQG